MEQVGLPFPHDALHEAVRVSAHELELVLVAFPHLDPDERKLRAQSAVHVLRQHLAAHGRWEAESLYPDLKDAERRGVLRFSESAMESWLLRMETLAAEGRLADLRRFARLGRRVLAVLREHLLEEEAAIAGYPTRTRRAASPPNA